MGTKQNAYTPGTHLLLDFFGASHLSDITYIETALRMAAQACSATILEIKLHSFGDDAGVTGVALLKESHITIHTWPEIHYAALDVFVCGRCDAGLTVPPLKKMFQPATFNIREVERGAR